MALCTLWNLHKLCQCNGVYIYEAMSARDTSALLTQRESNKGFTVEGGAVMEGKEHPSVRQGLGSPPTLPCTPGQISRSPLGLSFLANCLLAAFILFSVCNFLKNIAN